MGDDLVQAARVAKELEPAVEAFAEATGALGPVREATGLITDAFRYRREVRLAKVLMKAAEKIKASGLPPHAVRDKLLRAVVEDGSMEEDESMQERWANLLASGATDDSRATKLAYATVLSELEVTEANYLDRLWQRKRPDPEEKSPYLFKRPPRGRGSLVELDNLQRLGVIRLVYSMPVYPGSISNAKVELEGVELTELGMAFMRAVSFPAD